MSRISAQFSHDPAPAEAGLPAHERVYRQMRDMILFGALAPGQPVTIQGLTETLGAGMTPVREALRRLTAEGALDFQGNRRIAVPVLDASAIAELTVARLALEPELARRATMRMDADGIAALGQADAAIDTAIAAGDITGYLTGNHHFHALLNSYADAPILTGLVETLWLRFGPSLRVVCGRFGTEGLPDRHKDLLAALIDRDAEAAARAMSEDVRQGMEQIAQGIAPPSEAG
ncbi:HTH-type transcriptional regulator McbR [Roseivivax sp. THAF40]|uniref:GntR family transcriptional regulator n=1 Tax=unclassified Roseivivax TaxID=2639302 RepID=UPI0012A7E98A|nr:MULTISPECIES: GntR family transcriptional regulator [unclassified Roseivivax]QFS84434.1 HTH-type transcriptional regulator McbR [Roseivivax sp. THAF197b]QFT48262.1 HTH-type transcriptional regulator McbR [Roseivivax sp. THAF40]